MKESRALDVIVGFIAFASFIFAVFYFSRDFFNYKPLREADKVYHAYFYDIDGVSVGSDVRIAGINVGKILRYSITKDYQVDVVFSVSERYKLPSDTMAIVATTGILGGRYIKIIPGVDGNILNNDDLVKFTQSAVSIEGLISLLKK